MNDRAIAYFSMEIALEAGMPTYSGGLGVLAGDTIKSAADLAVPMVAVSLLYRKGYFFQRLDATGRQTEESASWSVDDYLDLMPQRVSVVIEGREVRVAVWRYLVEGVSGYKVPVYFLDTDLAENSEWDRTITHSLYGQDEHYRLCQEIVLGVAGVRVLHAMGYTGIRRYHMNEGHAALLTLELLLQSAQKEGRTAVNRSDVETVRNKCVFTTHTPVPAGHDKFSMELVAGVMSDLHRDVIDSDITEVIHRVLGAQQDVPEGELLQKGSLNMTLLALNLSRYINGVAKKHGEVSQHMFADYAIDSITNGVHVRTWAAPPFQRLFDSHISGWAKDNFSLRSAFGISDEEVWQAHQEAKAALVHRVNRRQNAGLDRDPFTIGFARRAASYKRADLLFHDPERLRQIAREVGPIQIVYGGKAHPHDEAGKQLIQRIFSAKELLGSDIRIVYYENYDMDIARDLVAGVDLWLNTPLPPNEASGTSGMKAALNGVPSLSILDGWWIEGCIEGVTGWAIGSPNPRESTDENDANSLYDKLEHTILPLYYSGSERFIEVMKGAIAFNGSFFNTQRMVLQYVKNAYFD